MRIWLVDFNSRRVRLMEIKFRKEVGIRKKIYLNCHFNFLSHLLNCGEWVSSSSNYTLNLSETVFKLLSIEAVFRT